MTTTTRRHPPWLKVRVPGGQGYRETKRTVRELGLHTVCQEAQCPNLGECWAHKTATFMLLGDTCTRNCSFCAVAHGRPQPVDSTEPDRVAQAVARLGLVHVVVTSVDRDDLPDGGAAHFAATVWAIKAAAPATRVEVLVPDFQGDLEAVTTVVAAPVDVFNHNVETVPRLYRRIRPGANFEHSVELLRRVKAESPHVFTKSGLMLGLGEEWGEVLEVLDALRAADVDFVTIGQYLRPSPRHAEVVRYWTPEQFDELRDAATERGFLMVSASPMTRSSYHADEDFERLRVRRQATA